MAKQNETLKARLARYSRNQHHRDRQKIGTHHLKPGLVRIGRGQALPSAVAGVGYTVVQERAKEPVAQDRR